MTQLAIDFEASRQTHVNSVRAYRSLKDLGQRQKLVLDAVKRLGRATDRQIAQAMGLVDMNGVRPRCTELVKLELLEECGDTICPTTGKRVRVVRVKQ